MSMNKPHLMNEATKEENERDVALLRSENQVLPIKYKHARVGMTQVNYTKSYKVVAIDENNVEYDIATFPFEDAEYEYQVTARIMAQQLADKINWG